MSLGNSSWSSAGWYIVGAQSVVRLPSLSSDCPWKNSPRNVASESEYGLFYSQPHNILKHGIYV